MTQFVWLNGEVMPFAEARVGVEDRGLQFADGVYEVVRLYDGRPFALDAHLRRMWNSAVDIQITPPLTPDLMVGEIDRLLAREDVGGDAQLYLQLTRGEAPRDHAFPDECHPTLLFYLRPARPLPATPAAGVALLSVPDDRWRRCWIKSTNLLSNVLAKNAALSAGCDEAAFIDGGGNVTEGSASNLFAVVGGKLVTHPVGSRCLPGITRGVVIELAERLGIPVDERALREEEAPRADELFITSTLREVSWVYRWNDVYIGQGRCGPVTAKLHKALRDRIRAETAATEVAEPAMAG